MTENLIDSLSKDLKSVRPVWPLGRMTAVLTTLWIFIVAGGLVVLPVREDIATKLANPIYLIELAAGLFAMVSCLFLFDVFSVPGRFSKFISPPWVGVAFLIIAVMEVIRSSNYTSAEFMQGMDIIGLNCFLAVVLISILPASALVWVGTKRAVMLSRTFKILLGLGGISAGILAIMLHCRIDNAVHVTLWHLSLPVALGAMAGTFFLAKLLKW